MAYSVRYRGLRARINQLRKQFLPRVFSPTGSYKDAELDNARAFRVLAHAELEAYFEERSKDVATAAFDLWNKKSKPSSAMVHILTAVNGELRGLPTKLDTGKTSLTVAGRAVAQFTQTIGSNNGITIQDLLKLLLPIGIQETEIDTAWLLTTEGFAKKRGATAHNAAIMHSIDPKDDYQTVLQIIDGVREIDLLINSIKARIR